MLEDEIRSLAKGPNFAVLTTIFPSGTPMAHVMWVDCDDENVLINTEVHRAKFKNVERNPSVGVAIWDRENPYRYAEIRGDVVERVTGPKARAHIDELSMKYNNRPYDDAWIQSERVILKVQPKRQRVFG